MDSRAFAVQLQKHISTEMMFSQALKGTAQFAYAGGGMIPEVLVSFIDSICGAESSSAELATQFVLEPLMDLSEEAIK
eukprot:15419300-Alexandrium_andersonii.AAC.1